MEKCLLHMVWIDLSSTSSILHPSLPSESSWQPWARTFGPCSPARWLSPVSLRSDWRKWRRPSWRLSSSLCTPVRRGSLWTQLRTCLWLPTGFRSCPFKTCAPGKYGVKKWQNDEVYTLIHWNLIQVAIFLVWHKVLVNKLASVIWISNI